MRKLKVLDLFSGLGGFSLGLERTGGFETVAFCEIEPFCQKVLRKHWPDVPIYDDVRNLNHDGTVDVICGGFPCTDISVAGKQAGIGEGTRSGLYWEMLRVISDTRPRFVIIENVSNLRSGSDMVNEYSVRCLCGWSGRWRGMSVSNGADKQRMCSSELLFQNVGRNEQQGAAFADFIAPEIRRDYSVSEREKNKSSRQDSMECSHQAGLTNIDCLATTHDCEAGTMQNSNSGMQADYRQARRFREKTINLQSSDTRNECSGASGKHPVWFICPDCGRDLDRVTTRYVRNDWLGGIFRSLAAIGYDAEWHCIPASAVGAPHRRDRIWIVAYHRGKRRKRIFPEKIQREPAFSWCQNVRRIEDLPERSDLYKSRLCRSRDGIPQRLDALGNAVVPAVVEVIGNAIIEAEQLSRNET